MLILHVNRRLVQKPKTKSTNQWVPNRFLHAQVVLQAHTEEEITELEIMSSDVIFKTLISDPEEYNLLLIPYAEHEDERAKLYLNGYEFVTPALNKSKIKGVYYFHQYLCDTPAVLALLDELYVMQHLKDSYPGTREANSCRILNIIRALDLFCYPGTREANSCRILNIIRALDLFWD